LAKVPFSRAAVEKEFMEHSTRDIEQVQRQALPITVTRTTPQAV
jgi:hypothetical protein